MDNDSTATNPQQEQATQPNPLSRFEGKNAEERKAILAQMTREELVSIKELMDKGASKVAKQPVETSWRQFTRNIGKAFTTVGDNMKRLNSWYLGNYMYTIYGGAFIGSCITCAAIIFQFIGIAVGATALASIIGSAIFLLPVLIYCVYVAIRLLFSILKSGVAFIQMTILMGKVNKAIDGNSGKGLDTVVKAVSEALKQPATNPSAY